MADCHPSQRPNAFHDRSDSGTYALSSVYLQESDERASNEKEEGDERMRSKHAAFALAMAACLVLSAGGCKRETPISAIEGQKTEIRLQIHWDADSPRGEAIRAILDAFEAKHEDIRVRLLGGAGDDRKLLTQIAGGDAPDVIETAYRNVQVLAKAGVLRQLEELESMKDAFYKPLWDLGTHEDGLYGCPWFGHTIQLVYNKKLFADAGIAKPPATWDELYAVAKKLTRDTDGDGEPDRFGLSLVGKQDPDITWLFTMFLHQGGGQLVKKENGAWRVALNSPEGQRALEFYVKLCREVCPPGVGNKAGGDVMADFRNRTAAMEFQGPWGVTDIWQQPEDMRFPVGAAEAPAGPGGKAFELGANMTVIPLTCSNPEAALKLVEYLAGREAQALLMEGEKTASGFVPFRVPVRTDLDDLPVFQEHPEFLPFCNGFAHPSIATPIPEWVRVKDEVYAAELNKAVLGIATPAEVLETIEKEGNRILGES